MFLQVFVSLILIVILLLWVYARIKYTYFRDRNIPYAEPSFPLGNIWNLSSWVDVHSFSYDLYFKFKGLASIGGYFTFTAPEVLISDLDVVQDILVNDFKYFTDHGLPLDEKRDPLGSHLYALRGEKWRNLRTKLSPAFSVQSIQAMFHTVFEVNQSLLQFVERFVQNERPINARDVSMRYICDSIGSCAFGMNCRAMEDENPVLFRIADRLFQPKTHEMLAYMAVWAYPKYAKFIPFVGTPKEVEHYFMRMIQETVQYREENDIHRNDFMEILIQMKNNGCLVDDESGEIIGSITEDELVAQAFLLFFYGFHTSRVMLTFALFELARNPKVQERARQEIFSVIGENGELTYQKLEQMSYLQQISDETLRKYPPSGHLERIANEDYVVRKGGFVIEKGTPVVIPVMGIQNDPDIYPAPDQFDPDRMTKEKMRQRHPASFLPLGGGPRFCIGHRFGYLQVKLALVSLLTQYRFSINYQTKRPRRTKNFLTEFTIDEDIWLNATIV